MSLKIVNIVATVFFNTELDLMRVREAIAMLGKTDYNPDVFPGLVVRTDRGLSMLIFRTGKAVIAGAKNIEEIKALVRDFARAIGIAGLELPDTIRIQVQNIVATGNLDSEVNLEVLSKKLKNALYEPEQFPGLIYRPGLGPVALIFSTGKVVLVGNKDEKEMQEVFEELRRTVNTAISSENAEIQKDMSLL